MDSYIKQKLKAKLLKINDITCVCLAKLEFCSNHICSQRKPHTLQYIDLFQQLSRFQTTKFVAKAL